MLRDGRLPAVTKDRICVEKQQPRAGGHGGPLRKLATAACKHNLKPRADLISDYFDAIIGVPVNNDQLADQPRIQPFGQRCQRRAERGGGIEGRNDHGNRGRHGGFRAGNSGQRPYISHMTNGYHDKTRQLLRISGGDRQSFLQGLVTNDVNHLAEGPIYAALLSAQGKYLFDFFLAGEGTAILLDVAASRAPALAQRLSMYRLRADVQIEADARAVWRGTGDMPEGAFMDPRHAEMGWRSYGDAEVAPLAEDFFEAVRVAHIIPEAELVENESYILEAGFERLNGVDFRKGCYVGQEITARMKHKTELKKGLRRVLVQGVADFGTPITTNGKPTGTLFTVVGDHGLAHLRYDRATGEMQADTATLTLA